MDLIRERSVQSIANSVLLLRDQAYSYFQVTPAGYSRMTQMLGDICGGKMLVILEGGYVVSKFLNSLLFSRGRI